MAGIRSFAPNNSAAVVANLASRNYYDSTVPMGMLQQGMTQARQIQPENDLQNLLQQTNQDNYGQNIGRINALAAQSSEPYQTMATNSMSQLDALTGRGIQQGTLDEAVSNNAIDNLLNRDKQQFTEQQAPLIAKAKVDAASEAQQGRATAADLLYNRDVSSAKLKQTNALANLGIQNDYVIGQQRPTFKEGDIVKNDNGSYDRVIYDQYTGTTKTIPSSEDAYNKKYGQKANAASTKLSPHTTQDGRTMMMTTADAKKIGAIPTTTDIALTKQALSPQSQEAIGIAIAGYETNPDATADKWITDFETAVDDNNVVFDQQFNFKQKKTYKTAISEIMKSPEYRKDFVRMNSEEKYKELNELLGITPKDSGSYMLPSVLNGSIFPDRVLTPSKETSTDKAFYKRLGLEVQK